MNWTEIKEQWKLYAGSARAQWSKLTDDDSQTISGEREQLISRIQERYGISDVVAGEQVDEWSRGLLELREVSDTRR